MYKGYNVIKVSYTLTFLLGFVGTIVIATFYPQLISRVNGIYVITHFILPLIIGVVGMLLLTLLMVIAMFLVDFHNWLKKEY